MKNNKLKILLKFLLLLTNFFALYYLYSNYGDQGFGIKLYPIAVLVFLLLSIILSFLKYLIWSAIFIASIGLILYGGILSAKSICTSIECGINGAVVIAPIIISTVTLILLLAQLIQFIIKRNKEKKQIG